MPDEEVVPEVEVVATGGMEIDSDQQIGQEEDEESVSYGSDEERSRAYIRALENVLERGRVIGQHALTRTQ